MSEGKEYAEIYDFITLPRPLDEVSSLTEEEMKRELTLVKNELCRAEEFARIAINCVSCSAILDEIREAYDLQDYVLEFRRTLIMQTNETEIVNGIEIEVDKAQRLIKKVIVKEKRNLSTKEFGSTEMVKKIKKMIEEEVECY